MTWGDLLDVEETPTAKPDDDVQRLAALVVGAGKAVWPDRLARALCWELIRVTRVANQLDDHLHLLGLRLQRNANGYLIRPLDTRTSDALALLNAIRDDEDGMHVSTARVLHQAMTGDLSRRETKNDHAVQIGALLNRGAIEVSIRADERYVVTDAVRYSLDF